MDKEAKAALKQAREAIRSKEYKEALQHCKTVLKHDKNNYNAFVFIGVAAEGVDEHDQALKAYTKAAEISPEQVLAWQGLAGFYEKQDKKEYKEHQVTVYKKLIELQSSDQTKCFENKLKMGQAYEAMDSCEEAVSIYQDLVESKQDDDAKKTVWQRLVGLLEKQKTLSPGNTELLVQAYEVVLMPGKADEDLVKTWMNYIKCLVKGKCDASKLLARCEEMISVYPEESYPVEILLLIKLDRYKAENQTEEDFIELSKKLENSKPDSAVLKIVQGFLHLQRKEYLPAQDLLQNGLNGFPQSVMGWLLLTETQLRLHDPSGLELSMEKVQKVSSKKDCFCTVEKDNLLQRSRLNYANVFLDVGDKKSVSEAINQCQKLLDEKFEKENVFVCLAYGYLLNADISQAREIVNKLASSKSASVVALQGWLLFNTDIYDEAIQCVQNAIDLDGKNGYYHYQLGRILWAQMKAGQEINKQDCLAEFIKAAKLDPYYSDTFLYLGHYYSTIGNDKQRASRCYQKSYDLKGTSDEVGIALVDCLNAIGEESTALKVLTSVTSQASAGSAKWAWLRLGLHHLKFNDPTTAVTCLQSALRADPNDYHGWECLAEAYLSRGSFTAALRTFTKATELCPDSMYSLYQIAAIKQRLGLHAEAVVDYNNVLVKFPDYVPALKGLGETQVNLAGSALHSYFNRKAVDLCEEAVWNLTRAATHRPDLACLWKLMADACTMVAPVSSSTGIMKLPKKLNCPSASLDESVVVDKCEVLAIGAKCYGYALKVLPEDASLWHDLGVNFYRQSQNVSSEKEVQELCHKSTQVLKKAICMDQNRHLYWLALGVVSLSSVINDVPLAQHCFIKSIQVESNNVMAWTNLGVLYLKHGKIELAHEAFKVAQSVDPAYVQCWIGQALIAETVGHDDAMDLFRHTSGLSVHVESGIGYASWVCSALQGTFKLSEDLYAYCIERMGAVPTACDAMAKYCDRVCTNPAAFTIYGMLLERQGLLRSALNSYASAVKLLESADDMLHLNMARSNYGRILCALGSADEAVKQYQAISPLESFEDVCGLALSYYKAGSWEDSSNAYTQAIELATSDEDKSHVFAALGMVSYKLRDVERAKTALFRCSQTSKPSIPGLLALCSIGLLQSDSTLVAAVLQELEKLTQIPSDHLVDVTYLTATLYVLMGDPATAKNTIMKQIHRYPNQPELWILLSQHLSSRSPQDSLGAAICAQVAYCKDNTLKDVSATITKGSLTAGLFSQTDTDQNAFYTAQKALHRNPHRLDYRCDMLAALFGETMVQQSRGTANKSMMNLLIAYSKGLLQIAENEMGSNPSPESTAVHLWCVKHYILALMCAGKLDQAKAMTEAALSLYQDADLPTLLAVSKNFMLDISNISDQGSYSVKLAVEYYLSRGLLDEVEALLKQAIQSSPHKKDKLGALLQFQHLSYRQILGRGPPKWSSVFMDAAAEVLRIDPNSSVSHLMRGLVRFKQTGMRVAKRHFVDVAKGDHGSLGQAGRIAEEILAEHAPSKSNENN
ncbi:tetratricopeptide repeat protein 37-like [Lineus longissimus]|uniref:tetratricopeptide repeat protein 37-like n=1 Tax=Lineus longissimus TaxID=88925 RepID=UPI00315C70DE